MKLNRSVTFLIFGLIFTIIFSFFFTPDSDIGDGPTYIRVALKILGENIPESYTYRSPLYPMILSVFIKIFGMTAFPRAVVFFQFLLIYFSAVFLYFIIFQLLRNHFFAVLAAIAFYFNPATIFYGYSVMSEILAVFLFLISVYLVFQYLNKKKTILLLLTGMMVILLILCRFNALPLIISYLIVFVIAILKVPGVKLESMVTKLFVFLIFPFVVILAISFYNIEKNGFFGLFPDSGSALISRNAILATLTGDELVKQENKPVLDIFIKAKNNYSLTHVKSKRGSLMKYDKNNILEKLYSGYMIYNISYEDLCFHFNLDPLNGENKLSSKLISFYREIKPQKRKELLLQRIYSFMSSFRSSSGIFIPGRFNNLGFLPGWLIICYKIIFLSVSIITIIFSGIYSVLFFFKKRKMNLEVIILIILCYSFHLINFVFGTVGDANRFKYPSDPLMIGLFIFFLLKIFEYQKENGITQIFQQIFSSINISCNMS
jgi:hypothetical protein